MPDSQDSKTVVITGASSGIGLGVARSYVADGANVVLNARNEGRFVGGGPATLWQIVARVF